ncbi:enolase 4 [Python bivittatus]|uniref:Enolase 4 n=1 Tax=Python bivittatus TaxID=176946 RepID=A0A9F5IJB1_PYTBI|nr:enolase 4 [Python bivittatus]
MASAPYNEEDDSTALDLPPWPPVSTDEIIELIVDLKMGKSPGPDGLPAELLKKHVDCCAQPLASLFMLIDHYGKIPNTWLNSIIISIYKKGGFDQPATATESLNKAVMACGKTYTEQDRQFTVMDLKHQAAEYYRSNEIPQRLEEVLNTMFYQRPADLYGYLANFFSELSKPPVICKLDAKSVLDGIGRPTLEVGVFCRIRDCDKMICSSMISSHAEILENASLEAIDADEKEKYESLNTAIEWINESLNEMLRGLQPSDQQNIDELLGNYFTKKSEEDKERREAVKEKASQEAMTPASSLATALPGKKKPNKAGKKPSMIEKPILPAELPEPALMGSLAIGCTSLAIAKTAATIRDLPLYSYIALLKHNQEMPKELVMPSPMITVLCCGKSSPGKLNLMKEVMLIPPAWLTVKQTIKRCMDIQKQMLKLIETVSKAPGSAVDGKKAASRDTGKKTPIPVPKKISHLGCLVMGCDSLEQPLILIQSACTNLSLELGIDIYLGINCAAHELMDYNKGKYEVIVGTNKSADEMVDMYLDVIKKFPSIIMLIDPLRKEDSQQWIHLWNVLGSKCYLIAEDSCRNMTKLLSSKKTNMPKCSGLVIKHTNEAKILDLVQMTQRLDGRKHLSILGSLDGESSDDSLADLAVGLGTKFIKLGGLSRGERIAKYNRLLAIEEELNKNGRLCERDEHEFTDLTEEEEEEEEELDYTDSASGSRQPAI